MKMEKQPIVYSYRFSPFACCARDRIGVTLGRDEDALTMTPPKKKASYSQRIT